MSEPEFDLMSPGDDLFELVHLASAVNSTEQHPEQPSGSTQPRQRYVEFDESDKLELIHGQQRKNTVRSTNNAVNQFYKWLNVTREDEIRPIQDIPPFELDQYLGSFFAGVRQKDGGDYEPDSLTTYQRAIDRHLKDSGYQLSICRDREFESSRQTLKAKRSQLKCTGKGNKPHSAEALSEREEEILVEKEVIGTSTPESLFYTVWLNNTKLFGFRGSQENRLLRWGDILMKTTADGHEYLEFNERENKTRSGEVSDTPRAYSPKAFAVPDAPDKCPVYAYKLFVMHRPREMMNDDAPFYLSINYHPDGDVWFKRQPMGVNKLGSVMKSMCEKAEIPGKKTNHSARKTTIQRLHDKGVPPTKIMQLSGHRNVQSINHYAINSLEEQRTMSDIITRRQPVTQSHVPVLSRQALSTITANSSSIATADGSSTAGGLLSGATLNKCTVNINISHVDNTSSPVAKRRRIAVIYDSSESGSSQDF